MNVCQQFCLNDRKTQVVEIRAPCYQHHIETNGLTLGFSQVIPGPCCAEPGCPHWLSPQHRGAYPKLLSNLKRFCITLLMSNLSYAHTRCSKTHSSMLSWLHDSIKEFKKALSKLLDWTIPTPWWRVCQARVRTNWRKTWLHTTWRFHARGSERNNSGSFTGCL